MVSVEEEGLVVGEVVKGGVDEASGKEVGGGASICAHDVNEKKQKTTSRTACIIIVGGDR